MSCGVAFQADVMLKHLKNDNHKFDKTVVDEVQFRAALKACNILSALPSPPTTLVPAVAGLMLHDGYLCSQCPTLKSTKGSIDRHVRDHKNKIHPQPYTPCHIQRFNSTAGTPRTWFQVQSPAVDIPSRSILDQYLMDMESQLGAAIYDPNTSNDPRTISPWLLSTKWHEEVEGKDLIALCESIKICSEWKNLHKAVLAWVHSLKTLEVTVDKNIRKKINTAKTTEDMYVILKLYWHVIDLSIETTVHSECICSRKPWTNMLQSWKVF